MTLAAVVRRPGVGRLGVAGLLSETGDWMLFIALPLYVLALTGSSLVTATVFALELVPAVVAAPLAGVLVDRCEPWRLMRTVAALQAVALLPLLLVDSPHDLWLVYLVVVVEAVLGTMIEPCRSTTAASLVPPADLMALNQGLGMLSSLARLVGGPLGGLVLGLKGIDGVLLVDAATFAGVAALFAWHPPRAAAARGAAMCPGGRPGVLREWREGFGVVARSAPLRRTMVVVGLAALAQGAFVVLFVLFVVRDLGGSEADVGVLRGIQAVGALAGGALLGAVIRRLDAGRLLAVSLAGIGALSLLIWNLPLLTTAFGVYIGLFTAVGLPGLGTMTGLLTLAQTQAPDAVRGRVLSTLLAVFGGMQALGMMLAGLVGTGTGLTVALEVQGATILLAAAIARGLSRPGPATPGRLPEDGATASIASGAVLRPTSDSGAHAAGTSGRKGGLEPSGRRSEAALSGGVSRA
jgi:Na+/melibiose symporter-like transporter